MTTEIINWAAKYLVTHGYTLKSNFPEEVQNTPWSYVVRFVTSDGYIYLKSTPPMLALEADIVRVLRDKFHASVPQIIAHNSELNCFLMHDAGRPLRQILKKEFDIELVCRTVQQFTSMQQAVAEHVNVFLDKGVPDWRLDKIPALFNQFLFKKEILIADGVVEKEIIELNALVPKISYLCEELSRVPIKQTIVQPDFNDNNVLIMNDSKKITIIDLGEIVISHPFFSLLNFLYQMTKHHGLQTSDEAYLKIRDVCLNPYMKYSSKEILLDALGTAKRVWHVYGILAGERLMAACGKEKIIQLQQGKLRAEIKELIFACANL